MSTSTSYGNPEFDNFAESYEQALGHGISATGENSKFFAQGRVAWLARCLRNLLFSPSEVLDFGCGTGTATPFLLGLPGVHRLIGVDPSRKSIAVARRRHSSHQVEFQLCGEFEPAAQIDLAFCNGVFHHIAVNERAAAVEFVLGAVRPGGLFAIWENNPWNPGTRYVMWRIPFDRGANPLSAPGTRRLLREGGFDVLRTDYLFVFPRGLRWFRRLEPALSRLPLGGQYQILARKPASGHLEAVCQRSVEEPRRD